jgi:hypothetical protein
VTSSSQENLQTKRLLSTTPTLTISRTYGNACHAFAKRQRLLSPEQYEIVEVRTSRGVSRVMLFSGYCSRSSRPSRRCGRR